MQKSTKINKNSNVLSLSPYIFFWLTNKMASGRLTGTPKIHFRALKCKSNLALKCRSTDFSVSHWNTRKFSWRSRWLWDMEYGMWDIYTDRMCAPPGPRPSNARSVRQLAEGHEFSCTRWQSRWMCNFLRVPITKCQRAWESSWGTIYNANVKRGQLSFPTRIKWPPGWAWPKLN